MVAALSFQYTFPFVGPQAKPKIQATSVKPEKRCFESKSSLRNIKGFHYINIYSNNRAYKRWSRGRWMFARWPDEAGSPYGGWKWRLINLCFNAAPNCSGSSQLIPHVPQADDSSAWLAQFVFLKLRMMECHFEGANVDVCSGNAQQLCLLVCIIIWWFWDYRIISRFANKRVRLANQQKCSLARVSDLKSAESLDDG